MMKMLPPPPSSASISLTGYEAFEGSMRMSSAGFKAPAVNSRMKSCPSPSEKLISVSAIRHARFFRAVFFRKTLIVSGVEVASGTIGGVVVAGAASGSAMLPYTVIKEANPPQFGGTATGVINFLNFPFSALLGPVFGWLLQHISGGAEIMERGHYQTAFAPLLFGVALAIVLSFLLKETGPTARPSSSYQV